MIALVVKILFATVFISGSILNDFKESKVNENHSKFRTVKILFVIACWIYFVGSVVATVEAWHSTHEFGKTVASSIGSWYYVYGARP